jgi:multiple sugar transport system ATP-binding protein
LLAGFIRPDAGAIRVGDAVLSSPDAVVPPERRGMGMVFQNYAVWPHKTVYDNVAFGLSVRKVARGEARARVGRVLEAVNLAGFEERYPSQLSGGQQQRVALARSLVVEPSILLLDEPLSNLDAKLRNSARDELKQFQRNLATTTIYVTHDQAEAMGLGDRIAVLDQGKVIQIGTPQEIYGSPSDTFVATFIGSPPMNLVDDGASYLGFRPEAFLPREVGSVEASLTLPFRVTRVEYLGADRLVYGVLEDRTPEAHVISKLPNNIRAEITAGERYDFVVRRSDVDRFDRASGRRIDGATR